MYKIVRQSEGIIRQIAENKSANNLITKDITPNVSLATTKATDYYEKEITPYDRIYFVLEGELKLTIGNETSNLQKGDACFIGKGSEYEMRGTFEAVTVNQPAFGIDRDRMKLYRFSPIQNKEELLEAIKYVHLACNKLCKQSFGEYLPNAGNLGIFCHYDDEYDRLIALRKEMTEASDNVNQKYCLLHEPITIPAREGVPETIYTHLYIRKPDPYRHHVGDVDFYLDPDEYKELKQAMQNGKVVKGARIFPRQDLDMIELYDPDVDACGYVSTEMMAATAHVKQSEETNL
jgi:hypothetical protein